MSKETIRIEVPEDLIQDADECAKERGFDGREDFVVNAIRDAVNAEDPFTEEARKQINKAREIDSSGISLEEAKEELGIED